MYLCSVCVCVCVSSGVQCFIRGLIQASASEDCRLMWPISSDYSCTVTVSLKHTCIQMHSGTKTNHCKGKSLWMWFMHLFVCLFFAFCSTSMQFVDIILSFACFISFSFPSFSSLWISQMLPGAVLMPVSTVNSSGSEWM